jgi:hypothetical protein
MEHFHANDFLAGWPAIIPGCHIHRSLIAMGGISFFNNPQQNSMSSPSTRQNPHNQRRTNHFPQKNSWHTRPYRHMEGAERQNYWLKMGRRSWLDRLYRGASTPPPAIRLREAPLRMTGCYIIQ